MPRLCEALSSIPGLQGKNKLVLHAIAIVIVRVRGGASNAFNSEEGNPPVIRRPFSPLKQARWEESKKGWSLLDKGQSCWTRP